MTKVLAIVPSAGIGKRADSDTPKQYKRIGTSTIFEFTINKLLKYKDITKVLVPISGSDTNFLNQKLVENKKISFSKGGNTRFESVFNAIQAFDDNDYDYVLIHDVVRPFFDVNLIKEMLEILNKDHQFEGVVPFVECVDSARNINQDFKPINRTELALIQTPQIFRSKSFVLAMKSAYDQAKHFSDESQVMENSNFLITYVDGNDSNIKITTPDDFRRIDPFDNSVGRGIDFHKYKPAKNSNIVLGTIKIKSDYRVVAHSDGDILLHALSDALLGAGGLRDIGYYFPDNLASNKNLDSTKILSKSLDLLFRNGLKPHNVDITIICESPKISPHVQQITEALSKLLKINEENIAIKSTTTEGLGVIGHNNGIAVYALSSLKII
tara:strand:+ start:3432 stop:4580 length:1149 start_codon:yes stop_codon:yes gene_type:complete